MSRRAGKTTRAPIVAALRSNQRFLVTTHHRPDGDALGSALACYHALAAQGKRVEVVAGGAVPAHYAFLPGVAVVRPGASRAPFEVLLAVDCDGADRMAVGPQVAARAPLTISIDHHATAEPFGDLRYLDPSAAAAGELIYYLLGDLGAPITPEIATCLYCAIATDTGFFRFVNTTARALAVCAELVRAGADPAEIAVKAYEEKSINALALLGRALERARLHADGQIIATCLAPADFAATGASHADTEGIIDRLKFVRGVRVAALLREVRDNEVYVSLRSTDGTNVAVVAARFGGGGHAVAAGCIVPGPLDEAYRRVVSAVAERLNGTKGEGR